MDSNIKEGTTIEMKGGMRNEEPAAASSEKAEERQVKRRTAELCSGISDFSGMKFSDVTENLKR